MRSRPLARESGDRPDRYEFLSEQARNASAKYWVNSLCPGTQTSLARVTELTSRRQSLLAPRKYIPALEAPLQAAKSGAGRSRIFLGRFDALEVEVGNGIRPSVRALAQGTASHGAVPVDQGLQGGTACVRQDRDAFVAQPGDFKR
jgi:hypothetical protein